MLEPSWVRACANSPSVAAAPGTRGFASYPPLPLFSHPGHLSSRSWSPAIIGTTSGTPHPSLGTPGYLQGWWCSCSPLGTLLVPAVSWRHREQCCPWRGDTAVHRLPCNSPGTESRAQGVYGLQTGIFCSPAANLCPPSHLLGAAPAPTPTCTQRRFPSAPGHGLCMVFIFQSKQGLRVSLRGGGRAQLPPLPGLGSGTASHCEPRAGSRIRHGKGREGSGGPRGARLELEALSASPSGEESTGLCRDSRKSQQFLQLCFQIAFSNHRIIPPKKNNNK